MTMSFVQLGKQGITDNFISTLKSHFQKHSAVKVIVLQNARPLGAEGRTKVKEYADKIIEKLNGKFAFRIIGFTISIRKKGK
jgi:RNA-binding protein YhbY